MFTWKRVHGVKYYYKKETMKAHKKYWNVCCPRLFVKTYYIHTTAATKCVFKTKLSTTSFSRDISGL